MATRVLRVTYSVLSLASARFLPTVTSRSPLALRAAWRTRQAAAAAGYSTQAGRMITAALCTKLGDPLTVTEVPAQGKLGLTEVRIAVKNAGVNFADVLTAQGKYQVREKPPFTSGIEFSGEVVEVGADVSRFTAGEKVVGLCMGAFATELVAPQERVWSLPHGIAWDKAAGMLIAYGTSLMGLTRRAGLREGETVLVTAAAGATGLAAIDVASALYDAKVIAACGSAAKCDLARDKGAFATIDYSSQPLHDKVKAITEGRGVDVIMDFVGGDLFKQCLKCIAWEGRIVIVGFASGSVQQIPANAALLNSCSIMGIWWGEYMQRAPEVLQENINEVISLCGQQYLDPHIGKVFPLAEVNEAFQYILDRKSMGKVVLSMD